MIKVEEIFDVTEEKILGKNPRTKEEIIITRKVFKSRDFKFYSNRKSVEHYINLFVSIEEWKEIKEFFEGYIENVEEDEDVLSCIKIMKENDVISYAEKVFLLKTFVDCNDCWCDFYSVNELSRYLGEEFSELLLKVRDVEEEEDNE